MANPPLSTRPPNNREQLLRNKYFENVTNQSEHMDKLGTHLITLELAIPGIYATALKLVDGDKATLTATPMLLATFGCWFLALVCALGSLLPRKWIVDTTIIKQDPLETTDVLGIEDFFYKTAQYKRRWLIGSSLFFFAGTLTAVFQLI